MLAPEVFDPHNTPFAESSKSSQSRITTIVPLDPVKKIFSEEHRKKVMRQFKRNRCQTVFLSLLILTISAVDINAEV